MRVMKIDQNLGTVERVVRFIAGIALAVWVLAQPERSALQWLALVVAAFLMLNGVLGRCYLWHILHLNSRDRCDSVCNEGAPEH